MITPGLSRQKWSGLRNSLHNDTACRCTYIKRDERGRAFLRAAKRHSEEKPDCWLSAMNADGNLFETYLGDGKGARATPYGFHACMGVCLICSDGVRHWAIEGFYPIV